jgi:type IV secretory pathway VirB6-like protein
MFAGIFLFLACFDKTREFFMNWIKTLIAAAFTIILSHSVLGLTVGSLDTAFSKLATSDISQGAFGDFFLMALLWCIVASLLMLMVPQVSQGITNVSFSIGGAAVTSAVGSAALTKTKLIGGKAAGYGYDTLKGGGAIQHGRQIYGGATNLLNKLRGVKG